MRTYEYFIYCTERERECDIDGPFFWWEYGIIYSKWIIHDDWMKCLIWVHDQKAVGSAASVGPSRWNVHLDKA